MNATVFDEGKIEMLTGDIIQRPKPFDKGFTNLVCNVLDYTNINSIKVPSRFRIEMFEPNRTSSKLITSWRMDGFVETTHPNVAPNFFPPKILGRTRVEDFRAGDLTKSNLSSVGYYTTNRWISTNSDEFNSLIKGELFQQKEEGRKNNARPYVLFFLIATSLIFFRALWKGTKANKNKQEQ